MTHVGRTMPGATIASRLSSLSPAGWSPTSRVWAFTVIVYVLAAAVYATFVRRHMPAPYLSSVAWPLLAAAFVVTEVKVVDVHFRRERHAFSLSEIPGVIGLFVLTPTDYLVALAVGTATALMFERRQARMRRTFNLANTLLVGSVTLGVFHGVAADPVGTSLEIPTTVQWIASTAATVIASIVGTLAVATVIALSGGAQQLQRLGAMVQFGVMVALANTSLALLSVLVLATQPSALLLLTIPIVTVYFAYRAYVSERAKHERLELLYESSRILQHSPELDASVFALVEHARRMFLAEISQIVIFPDRAAGQALTTTSVADGPEEVMVPTRPDEEPELWRRVREERRAFFWRPAQDEAIGGRLLRQVMASPLTGEAGPLGMLLVANRSAQGTEFDVDDLRLLETVANQVGVALENGQLERSLGELSRLKEELRHQAFHDALTGLPNRALFSEEVELRLATRSAGEEPVVLFLDLDDFKVVNDTLGHAVGDRLLVAVADRIKDCVRSDDVAARLGGDEFAILLSRTDGMVDAVAVGERLVTALRAPFHVDGQDISVGASVGVAAGRQDTQRGDDLLRNADVAMYTAKTNGKRRLAVFDPLLHAELVARHQLSAELSRSLGRGELLVHYQPIVELASERIAGVEALVRWRHPTRGFVPPDEFVHLAEENGSIDALGTFVLAEACRQTAAWRRRMDPDTPFSVNVNVSPRQLQHALFAEDVEATLQETGLEPRHLVLEMTETGMLHDTAATISRLSVLQRLGVRVAMDDFGTGYSSLSYLRRFPIDILKIARDFIAGGPDRPGEDDWAFAEAIVALGHTLRLSIVAEGIEDRAQLARLVELGCAFGQGFYFSRPMPPEEVSTLLASRGLIRADPESVPGLATAGSPA